MDITLHQRNCGQTGHLPNVQTHQARGPFQILNETQTSSQIGHLLVRVACMVTVGQALM